MNCPYCGQKAVWCENKAIYGKNYGKSYMCYYCQPCDAYVGCHKNSKKPLGTMANRELRDWRKKAHAIFDPFWKEYGLKRQEAYDMLKMAFGIEIHIAEADVEMCKKIIRVCHNPPT